MMPWLFWLLVIGVPTLTAALGALGANIWDRTWIDRIRDKEWDNGYREGWHRRALHAAEPLGAQEMIPTLVSPELLTEAARSVRLDLLIHEVTAVIRADFGAIRDGLALSEAEISNPSTHREQLQLAHDETPAGS